MDEQLAFNLPLRGPIPQTAGFNMPIQGAPPMAPPIPQQQMPQQAPPFQMAMQPAQPPPMQQQGQPPGMAATQGTLEPWMNNPYVNPAAPVQQTNFLNDADIQASFKTLLQQKLKLAAQEEASAKSDKRRETATKIFGGIIAPALAIFGGPGTAAGAAQFVQQARQSVDQGRLQRQQDERAAEGGIKDLVNIVNTTTTKPLLDFMKIKAGVDKVNTQQQNANWRNTNSNTTRRDINNQNETGRNKRFTAGQELKQRMGEARIGLGYDRIDSMERMASQTDERVRSIAALNAKIRQGVANQSEITQRQKLIVDVAKDASQLADGQAQHMNEVALKISKGGLTDAQGNPLNPDDFGYQLPDHVQSIVDHYSTQPNQLDYDSAIEDIKNPTRVQEQVSAQPMGMGQQQGHNAMPPTAPAYSMKPLQQEKPEEMKRRLYASAQRQGIPYAEARKRIEGRFGNAR